MPIKRFLFFLSGFMIALSTGAIAQDKVWTGAVDSSWHTPGNWNPGGVPGSNQTVSIRNNTLPHPVITTNVTVRSLDINQWWDNPADELTIRNNATLTITDDLGLFGNARLHIINGHVEMTGTSGGDFNMNGNSIIEIESGSFTAGTSNEDIDVDVNGRIFTGNGEFTIYGDLTVANNRSFNLENGSVTVNGNTEINGTFNGDNGTSIFNESTEVRSGGTVNLGSGTMQFNDKTSVRNNGTANFGSGTVTFTDEITVRSSGFFNVQDADVTVAGDATFQSNGNLTVNSGSINIEGDASLKNGGTIDLNSGSLNVGGDASFSNGGEFNAGSGELTLEGDFELKNGSDFNADSSTVIFSGDDEQEIKSKEDIVFYNLQVDSGSVVTSDGGKSNLITIEGDLVMQENAYFEIEDDDELDVQGQITGPGAGNIQSRNPFAVSAAAVDLNTVVITFNRAMEQASVENTSNYSIQRINGSQTLSVNSATLNTSGDSRQVTLSVSTITENVRYMITMNDLESTNGRSISRNHKKRFVKFGAVTLYSRTSGDWDSNNTWSRVSHSGPPANFNPTTANDLIIIVGDGDVVTITGTATITGQESVEVTAGSILRVNAGGILETGTETISGNGTFRLNSGTLQIGSSEGISASGPTGNIQTATRNFSANGSYQYNGTSAQVAGSGLPGQVNDLTINNASGVRLNGSVETSGTLFLDKGTFTLSSGSNLIANNKSIGTGELQMELNISGSNGWRLLSTPLISNYDDLLDNIVTQGYQGAFYSTGSLPGDTLQPNVLYYEESYPGADNQRWRAPSSADATVDPALGLYTYIFGDIATDPLYNNPIPLTLSVNGQEQEGPVDFEVTYSPEADSGWNLVGNPFAATIDWDDPAWTKTNMDNTIYVWDHTTNQYLTWNGTVGSLGSGRIAPFQGFWVKANGANPSLIAPEDVKSTGGFFVGKQINSTRAERPAFSIRLSNDRMNSDAHFMFSDEARLGKDSHDAYKLLPPPGIGSYLEFSSQAENGDKFAINNLPRDFGRPIEIPLQLEAYHNGFTQGQALHLEFRNFKDVPGSWDMTLIDTQTGNEMTVKDGSVYPFEYKPGKAKAAPNTGRSSNPKVKSTTSSKARFILRIEPGADAGELPQEFELTQNYPNPFNPQTNIQFSLPVQSRVQLIIFDMLGRQVAMLENAELKAGTHTYSWDAGRLASGVYLYRLITDNKVITRKMTLIK